VEDGLGDWPTDPLNINHILTTNHRRILLVTFGCMVSLLLVGNVYGAAPLSQSTKAGIVGEYRFEGDWKNLRNVLLELTVSVDEDGELVGKQLFKSDKDAHQGGVYSTYTKFRRLTSDEWTYEWKVRSLSGARCDRDRHCVVANAVHKINWQSEEYVYTAFQFHQYSLDFTEVERCAIGENNGVKSLSVPYMKVSE